MWCGNEFHREGAATEKGPSPQVRHLVLGICMRLASGGGMLVEEVGGVGGSQVVEGLVGGEENLEMYPVI